MSAPAWYVWGKSKHPIDWDDECGPQKFYEGNDPQRYDETRGYALSEAITEGHEAPADLTPDMYDDPYMEFADPADEALLDREASGYYDDEAFA